MILEELYPLIRDSLYVVVKDCNGSILAEYNGKDSISKELNEFEVDRLDVGCTGEALLIYLKGEILRVTDIDWDTDGADVELPSEVFLKDIDWLGGWDDEVADELSDRYGFCVNSFKIYNH